MQKMVTVVGSGPNGLMATIILSQSGYRVRLIEAGSTLGGGLRSFKNPQYGTIHDMCSAVHPMAVISPAFRSINLHHDVEMVYPDVPFAHAFTSSEMQALKLPQIKLSQFAGTAAHGMVDPFSFLGLGIGTVLYSTSKILGWPIPVGGSQSILNFLLGAIDLSKVDVKLDTLVNKSNHKEYLEGSSAVIWDTLPDLPLDIIQPEISYSTKTVVGAAKADYVLSEPIPWSNKNLLKAGTVHLGGSYQQVRSAEQMIRLGKMPENPFVILSQPSLFDKTRSSEKLHTVWAYAHVPNNSTFDAVSICNSVIERYAPGFTEKIVYSASTNAADLENYNPNYKGGDILSGSTYKKQMIFWGAKTLPWCLPKRGWFLCSSSVFPGPGVHGLGGMITANLAMKTI